MKMLLLAAVFVSLLVIGFLGLFFPESIQEFASKSMRINLAATGAAMKAYVQTYGAVLSVRAVGLAAFGICVLLALNLYRRAR